MSLNNVAQLHKDRLPPQDIEIEASILSSCIIDSEEAIEIIDIINPGVFYRTAHQKIFEAISHLIKTAGECELIALKNYLEEKKQLEEIGGASYLAELINEVPIAVNIEYACKKLQERSALRDLGKKAYELYTRSFDVGEDPEALIDEAQRDINNIAVPDTGKDTSIRTITHTVCDQIDYRIDHKQEVTGVDTGFTGLNWYTGGLQPTDLIILAARPSMGKTSIALNLLRNAAKKGVWVDFYSYEMSKEQLVTRLISMAGRVKYQSLRSGYLTKSELNQYNRAAAEVSEYTATIEDNGDLKIGDVRRRARKTQKKHGTGLVIVDYMQLIPKEKLNTNDAVGDISRSLKMMAKELNVPVVALSQLNRKVEERGNKIPTLADLRDSGSIEQDADVVLFPFRPALYIDEKYEADGKTETQKYSMEKEKALLFISKHRNGPIGCAELKWEGEYSSFENIGE